MSRRVRRARVREAAAFVVVTALACACVTPGAPKPPSGDELLASGDVHGAAAAYQREVSEAADASERGRARLLWAVALLSSRDPLLERQGLELLRELEDMRDGHVWAHVARALAAEVSRSEVLRRTIMRAGADVEELRTRLALCEEQLAAKSADHDALAEEKAALAEELAGAQRKTRELEAELLAREARLRQLEEELSALKDIDMQRDP